MTNKKMGRTGKVYDSEVINKLLDAVRIGVPVKFAATHAGVDERTVYLWQADGEAAAQRVEDGETITSYQDACLHFLQELKKARNDAITVRVANIKKAGQKSWQAEAWWLERMYPEEFALKTKQTLVHEGELNVNSKTSVTELAKDKEPLGFASVVTGYLESATAEENTAS